jgi:adenine phosphoribosyltransferase
LGIKPYIGTVNDFPIPGIKFKDITSLIEAPLAFIKTCKELTRITKLFESTLIVSIESRGFIFAGSVAYNCSLPFVLARKPGKLPNETYKKDFDLEYGSTSIEVQKNTQIKNTDKVVIIDDLVATGGTAIACADLLNDNFNVTKDNILILTIINLTDLVGSQRIKNAGYKFKTIVSY